MSANIHPTAIVDSKAIIGAGVSIGAYSTIGPNVTLGDGVTVGPRTSIDWAKIGKEVTIGANCVIGSDPQYANWTSVPSWVEIGAGSIVNELSVIHRSIYEDKATVIGEKCFVMAQAHIGHDCILGREVTVTTLAGLSGHVEVGDYAYIGGSAGIHQFVRIGTMAMIGGMTLVTRDAPPYFTLLGVPAESRGLNNLGMRRRGIGAKERSSLKAAFKLLVRDNISLTDAYQRIKETIPVEGAVKELLDFIKTSKRGVTL